MSAGKDFEDLDFIEESYVFKVDEEDDCVSLIDKDVAYFLEEYND